MTRRRTISVEDRVSSQDRTAGDVSRPPVLLLAAEVPRAIAELALLAASRPLLARTPAGDGHPVIVLPGFFAGDGSTGVLRGFLRSRGYHVHGWGLGRNTGPTKRILNGLEARFRAVSERHGQKCSLVGWSLGGMFARELAREAPDAVRQVITLGTPFQMARLDQLGAGRLYAAMSSRHDPSAKTIEDLRQAPALKVPSTAIYSRSDGFAPWQDCQDGQGPLRESIEVIGSHGGLGHNPAVLAILADRLAQPDGTWSPFDNAVLPRLLRVPRRRVP